jgi:hypothetical protein
LSCSSCVRRMVCGMGAISRSEVMSSMPDRTVIQKILSIWNRHGFSVKTGPYLSFIYNYTREMVTNITRLTSLLRRNVQL